MRTFVLWARKAKTTANFSLDDLPGSGRMDLVCRCISNALCTSDHLRKDTRIYVILEGPPTPPITLLFDGGLLQQLDFDERSIAQHIQNALRGKTMLGVTVQKKSFERLIQELATTSQLIYLHEKGEDLRLAPFQENTTFLFGDFLGLPAKTELFLERLHAKQISLGPKSLFASHCVTLVHNELDRRYSFK